MLLGILPKETLLAHIYVVFVAMRAAKHLLIKIHQELDSIFPIKTVIALTGGIMEGKEDGTRKAILLLIEL